MSSSFGASMESWTYRAPRHIALGAHLSPTNSDSFFDLDQESYESETVKVEVKNVVIKQEVISPPSQNTYEEKTTEIAVKKELITPHQKGHRRRSMSVHVMENFHSKANLNNNPELAVNGNKNSSQNNLKSDKKVFQHPKYPGKASSVSSLQSNSQMNAKYIPMAEAIYHSQHDTPERFHTHSKNQVLPFLRQKANHLQVTIPQSPALSSKTRNRNVNVLSQKQIEDLEIAEIKKHKFKALAVSKAALYGYSNLPQVQRRPKTRPDPFNLTEMKKKIVEKQEEKFVFTARPIPKNVLNKPLETIKKNIPTTVPISPNITKTTKQKSRSMEHLSLYVPKRTKCPLQMASKFGSAINDMGSVGHSGVPLSGKSAAQPCKPIPFSFEVRDKQREMMKNQKINKVLEEEKKLREFRANPIPVSILKISKAVDVKNTSSSPKQKQKENKENCVLFKARPPLVLHKDPFVPARSNRPQTEPCPIELTTDRRARERDAFNQKIKEKEEYLANLRKLKEDEERQNAEREIMELRTKLVHKAAPIKHYAPLTIQSSNIPLTFPKGPSFGN